MAKPSRRRAIETLLDATADANLNACRFTEAQDGLASLNIMREEDARAFRIASKNSAR